MPFIGTKQTDTVSVGLPVVSRGLRAESLPAPVHLHAQLSQFMNSELWRGADNPAAAQNVVAKFSQSMSLSKVYSREDLFTAARPYAGLSCVGLAWNRCCLVAQTEQEMLDTREVTLGVIGLVAQAVVALGIIAGRGYKWVDRDACLPLARVRGAEHESGLRLRRPEHRVLVGRRERYTH